jgi:hypothetical protein
MDYFEKSSLEHIVVKVLSFLEEQNLEIPNKSDYNLQIDSPVQLFYQAERTLRSIVKPNQELNKHLYNLMKDDNLFDSLRYVLLKIFSPDSYFPAFSSDPEDIEDENDDSDDLDEIILEPIQDKPDAGSLTTSNILNEQNQIIQYLSDAYQINKDVMNFILQDFNFHIDSLIHSLTEHYEQTLQHYSIQPKNSSYPINLTYSSELMECPICLDQISENVSLICGHFCCLNYIIESIEISSKNPRITCHSCHLPIPNHIILHLCGKSVAKIHQNAENDFRISLSPSLIPCINQNVI